MEKNYTEFNSHCIDRWVAGGWEWGVPISREAFERARAGEWEVFLTPTRPVPRDWFCPMKGAKILGLASGGGQQMPVFCALGAECTVLDYSQAQLETERMVAQREGYDITVVRADMTRPLPFPEESFDLIFHPVSNCYVEEVLPIWRECARVLKRGGLLLSGLVLLSGSPAESSGSWAEQPAAVTASRAASRNAEIRCVSSGDADALSAYIRRTEPPMEKLRRPSL